MAGSALLMVLATASIAGIVIGATLNMVASQNKSVARSQSWNTAIPTAEAGVEEAFTQINYTKGSTPGNGWTLSGTNYCKSRTNADGSIWYRVAYSQAYPPVILSTGYVTVPLSTNQISRVIRIQTQTSALFAKGLVSMTIIRLNGNDVTVDSFDSTTNKYSTNGRYDSSKRKDNGDVASVQGVQDILNIGNAKIYGSLHTGPGGTASVGANGSVGDTNWVDGGTKGLQSGHFADDMNVSFPDVDVPSAGTWFTPSAGTIDGTNYTYVLTNAPPNTNYQLSSLSGNIYVGTNALLYVPGSASLGGVVINTNAGLKLYHGTSDINGNQSVTLSGNTTVNSDGRAIALQYYGLPSVKSITLVGNAGYVGTIYAPQADFTLNGSGSTEYDVVGSTLVKSVTLNGHFNFHYDESLAIYGPERGLVVFSWVEL